MTDRTEYLVRYGVGGVGRSGSYRSLASPIASRINGKKLGRVPPTKALSALFLGRLTELLNPADTQFCREYSTSRTPRRMIQSGANSSPIADLDLLTIFAPEWLTLWGG